MEKGNGNTSPSPRKRGRPKQVKPVSPPKLEATAPEANPPIVSEAEVAGPTAPSEPIAIIGLPDDLTVRVAEINQFAEAVQGFDKDTYERAQEDNLQRDFVEKIMEARRAVSVKPYIAPPIPAQISEQTRMEMEAGKKRVAHFEEQERLRPRPHRNADVNGTMVPVFRPDDFIPDPRKGQGVAATSSYRPLDG